MRKWIAVLLVLFAILVCIYWLLPARINIRERIIVPANTKAFAREIANEDAWKQWWPGKQTSSSTSFEYNGNTYKLTEKRLSSILIDVSKGTDSVLTELFFVPVQQDSIELTWSGASKSFINPFERIQNSSWAKSVKTDIDLLLKKIQAFYSNEDNLYGFHIEKSLVADSNYISTSTVTRTYPSTSVVYDLIDQLKNYINKNNAKETGNAMLNIYRNSDSTYLVRVAIPTDKKLTDDGDIKYRWMLKGGNILVAEVKGGSHQIEKAFSKMANYVDDHQRIAPAIPFQSLITDRRQEPDSNKWVTKIYWPVM